MSTSQNDRSEAGACHCACHHCNSGNHGRCSFECHGEIKDECMDCGQENCICDDDDPREEEDAAITPSPYADMSIDQIISRMKEIEL